MLTALAFSQSNLSTGNHSRGIPATGKVTRENDKVGFVVADRFDRQSHKLRLRAILEFFSSYLKISEGCQSTQPSRLG
jgi:hypothetical protein